MQVVILAGGLGTRMRPHTEQVPKALINIHGYPFVEYQLRMLKRQGITQVVLCIGYQGHAIRDFVGDGRAWNMQVRYSDEGTTLRGTAGALRFAQAQGLLAEEFAVLYGDSYLPIAFAPVWEYFELQIQPVLLTIYANQDLYDTSNVVCLDNGLIYYDKRRRPTTLGAYTHIDYGLSVLRSSVLEKVPADGAYDLGDLVSSLSAQGGVRGYVVSQRFYEIGSPAGLEDFCAFMAKSTSMGTASGRDETTQSPATRRSS